MATEQESYDSDRFSNESPASKGAFREQEATGRCSTCSEINAHHRFRSNTFPPAWSATFKRASRRSSIRQLDSTSQETDFVSLRWWEGDFTTAIASPCLPSCNRNLQQLPISLCDSLDVVGRLSSKFWTNHEEHATWIALAGCAPFGWGTDPRAMIRIRVHANAEGSGGDSNLSACFLTSPATPPPQANVPCPSFSRQ